MINQGEKQTGSPAQFQKPGLDGTATHSGWMHFNKTFAKYREQCILLGKNVLGSNFGRVVNNLSEYHSLLYSMAQQLFSFYDEKTETKITNDWLDLGEEVEEYLLKISDKDFRKQMSIEGKTNLDKSLKVKLLKFFNKIDRMAAGAGLLVGQEQSGSHESKKGLLGLKR